MNSNLSGTFAHSHTITYGITKTQIQHINMENDSGIPSRTRFASIAIHQTDKLRLLKFTDAEVRAIENVIQESWHKPIQSTRIIAGSAKEFKLAGRPWCCGHSSEDATASRVLVRDLLAYLFSLGLILSLPTGISTKQQDCDTLIFREQPQPPPESEWLVIMFGKVDILRVIGAPHDLLAGIQAILKSSGLIQEERWENRSKNSYDFKLHGSPWMPWEEESVGTRMLVVTLLETLERFGWSLYTSLQHNYFGTTGNQKDDWYCVRMVNWMPGMPVFHR